MFLRRFSLMVLLYYFWKLSAGSKNEGMLRSWNLCFYKPTNCLIKFPNQQYIFFRETAYSCNTYVYGYCLNVHFEVECTIILIHILKLMLCFAFHRHMLLNFLFCFSWIRANIITLIYRVVALEFDKFERLNNIIVHYHGSLCLLNTWLFHLCL